MQWVLREGGEKGLSGGTQRAEAPVYTCQEEGFCKPLWGNGPNTVSIVLFRPTFGRENSLSFSANSVSDSRSSVSSLLHTINRLRGTH